MRIAIPLLSALLLTLFIVSVAEAQLPTARIVIRGASPEMVKTGPWSSVSSGLSNVGLGTKVWLEAKAVMGSSASNLHFDTITTLTWRIISKPAGSSTSLVNIDTATGLMGLIAVMLPDSQGVYDVGLTVTTANGTSAEAVRSISAGQYVGVGGLVDQDPDYLRGECLGCHSDKAASWKTTKHSSKFSRDIDGLTGVTQSGSYYAANCVRCHTVGVNKDTTAANHGFDDVASQFTWTPPDTMIAGNWDSMKVHYPEVAKMANIQCENCHGPGNQHFGDATKIAYSLSADVCSQCHDALSHHPKRTQWNVSAHSRSVAGGSGGVNIESKNRAPCAQCHTGQGFIDVTIDGGSLNVPYADVQPVSCAACHDPHDGSHEKQLRRPSVAEACTGCHKNRLTGAAGLHESHQGPMLAGSSGTSFGAQFIPDSGVYAIGEWGGWQLPGYAYPNSSHSTLIAEKCVQCHMAEISGADTLLIPGVPYSQYRNKLGGHTFSVKWDHDTPLDESDDIINPVGCKDCHGTVSMTFVKLSQNTIRTLLDSLRLMLPLRSTGSPPPPKRPFEPGLTDIQRAASYNWYFVNNDGSFGVHNHSYARALLESSIRELSVATGVGVERGDGIPTAFELAQNYPNPFNPSTSIRYDLPKAAHVKITVYDMLGNDITTLVNSDFEAGSYTVNWDATGRNGNAAASGVYLYKIEAGTFTSVKKMALVR